MNVQEFIAGIGKRPPAPLTLFMPFKAPRGSNSTFDQFLADRAISLMVDTYTDSNTKDFAFNAYHGDEADAGEIVSVARTYPFLVERRVVVVYDVDEFQMGSGTEAMLAYFAEPSESTIMLMVAPNLDRRLKLFKALEKTAELVECPELRANELTEWVRQEAARIKKKISSTAAAQLVERAGTSLSDVNNALTVVSNYVGERAEIAEKDVLAACADVAEEQIWALTDAIAGSDTANAVRVLKQMFELGKSEFEILGTVNWLIKNAYNVASAAPGDPILNLYQNKKVVPLVKKFGLERLRRAFGLIVDTDFMLRSTGVDRNLALELLVIRLAAPAQRRRAASA